MSLIGNDAPTDNTTDLFFSAWSCRVTQRRYEATGAQAEYQPGSNDEVLANALGITDPSEMAEAELVLLDKLYEAVVMNDMPHRRLTIADLRTWHRRWLGNVYAWAGQDRTVNISKGNFHFAMAAQVPRLLAEFERDYLVRYTPCAPGLADDALAAAIAETHAEFILIHPFRVGNGRVSRVLADVMAVQAGRMPLDYSTWEADKPRYFAAIQRGLSRDYSEMTRLTMLALESGA